MIKFFKRMIIFALIAIFILVLLEFTVRQIPNNYSYKNNYLNKNSSSIEILSLGSSHSIYAIDPIFFDKKGFNAAHVSQTLSYDFLIWEKYKSHMDNLEVVILPLSYFTLFSELEDGSEAWRLKNYSIYYGLKSSKLKYNLEILSQRPLSIARMVAKMVLGKSNLTITELGFSNKYGVQQDLETSGKEAALRHTKTNFIRLDENISFLSKILKTCDERGIEVILITTPTTDYYWQRLDQTQLDLMHTTIYSILDDFPTAKYYDFLKDARFKKSDFRDADHLNPNGAEKFSKILNEIIMKPKHQND